jgi:hypothetical protein
MEKKEYQQRINRTKRKYKRRSADRIAEKILQAIIMIIFFGAIIVLPFVCK